jgi:Mn-dependent DtxR family transcriptional regulator
LAKWILLARDRTSLDTLELTQEFIAEMLGASRTSVNVEARTLAQTGLIDYRRGRIQIRDREGLMDVCCECYETISARFARMLGPRSNW